MTDAEVWTRTLLIAGTLLGLLWCCYELMRKEARNDASDTD